MANYKDTIESIPGLVAYWRLGEGSGTSAVDETGNYNGTYVNAPLLGEPGLLFDDVDTSVTFDGVDEEITNSSIVSELLTHTTGSISFIASFPVGGISYASFGSDSVTDSYVAFFISENHAFFIFRNATTAGTEYFYIGTDIAFTADTIYNLTYVQDPTDGALIYINGVLQTTYILLGTPGNKWFSSNSNLDIFSIGSNHVSSAINYYEGSSDEVAIWDTKLTQEQITTIYRASQAYSPSAGVLNVTGKNPNLLLSIPTSKGNVHISGNVPIVTVRKVLTVSKGVLNTTGKDVIFEYTEDYFLTINPGQVNVTGGSAAALIGSNLHINKGQLNVIGNTPIVDIKNIVSVIEYLSVSSLYKVLTYIPMLDSINATDNITVTQAIVRKIKEKLFLDDAVTTTMSGSVTIVDSITLSANLRVLISEILTETMLVEDVLQGFMVGKNRIIELITHTDVISANAQFKNILIDSLNIVDNILEFRGFSLTESLNVNDTIEYIVKAVTEVIETILVEDVTSPSFRLVMFTSESLNINDSVDTKAIFKDLISDTISTFGTLTIPADGIGESEQYTFVMNSKTKGISEYTNYNFNSMSEGLAATSTGIYAIGGTSDAGTDIDALIKTGLVDFGTSKEKQVPYCYIGLNKSGEMILKTIVDYRGTRKEYWYDVVARSIDATDTIRIKMSKGVKSRYWAFELTNKDGSDFELDSLELLPLTLKRRI